MIRKRASISASAQLVELAHSNSSTRSSEDGIVRPPALRHQYIQLLINDGRQRHRHAALARRFEHQAEILVMQASLDAGREIAAHHALAHHVEHARGGRTAGQRLLHPGAIDTGRGGQAHRLGRRLDGGHHDHLVTGLGHLPGAIRADMHDALAEALQQWPDARQHIGLAAGHDRQRGIDGPLRTAGNRRIEHGDAFFTQSRRDVTGDIRRNGRAIDQHRAGRHALDQAVRAEGDGFDIGTRRDDGKHHLALPPQFGRRRTNRRRQAADAFRTACPDVQRMPGTLHMQGHRTTHHAKADEADLHACPDSFSSNLSTAMESSSPRPEPTMALNICAVAAEPGQAKRPVRAPSASRCSDPFRASSS